MSIYESVLKALRGEKFISLTIAREIEIAKGTIRMKRALHAYAELLHGKKLKLKNREKALLYPALYQYYYMNNAAEHAIVNETVELAKKKIHPSYAKFINALLRKLKPLELPNDLAIRYSYPDFFAKRFPEEILIAGNTPPIIMARKRPTLEMTRDYNLGPDFYIQNETPVHLIKEISKRISPPKTILDLCAAPGGKAIAFHDLYPDAELTVNDIKALTRLEENLDKCQIKATKTQHPAEKYPTNKKFDLIILDAPCTNTGVLNKRVEARWRLTPESIKAHVELQKKMIQHALQLLTPNGALAYMTCSILSEENEELIKNSVWQETRLPNINGQDGGFAALTII